jgi:hypothetical protein
MAEPGVVTDFPRPLPTEISLRADELEVGFTPRELRQIKEETGRAWSQILADETDDTDKFKVFAWLRLRRDGYTPSFEEMDDVLIRLTLAPPDPTSGEQPKSLPPSATTGE